jgi:hypothetical protein
MRTGFRALIGPLVATLALVSTAVASADSPFVWSSPTAISSPTEYLAGVSCVSGSLCVAADHKGGFFQSLGPLAGMSWSSQTIAGVEPGAVSCVDTKFCVVVSRDDSVLYTEDASSFPIAPAWVVEEHADHSGSALTSISCVSKTFCVAADEAGNILTSTNPAGGAGTWVAASVDRAGKTNKAIPIYGVACPSESLCVASDGAGRILTSTNPTGGESAWQVRSAEGNVTIFGISCASPTLCVAVDAGGNVLVSTDPSAESWSVDFRVDAHPLDGISCILPASCVAVDEAGNVVSSSAVAGGPAVWTVVNVDGGARAFTGVSCTSAQRCVATDNHGSVLIGTAAPARTLSVSVFGTGTGSVTGGGLNCPRVCSSTELNGSTVTLTPTLGSASVFVGWGGACSGAGSCTLEMNADASVSAEFAPKAPSPTKPPDGSGSALGAIPSPTVAGALVTLPTGVAIPLHCWAKSGSCTPVTLALTVVETLHGKRVIAVAASRRKGLRRKKVVVAQTRVTLQAGQTVTARVLLNRNGRSLLHARHRFSASLTITANPGKLVWQQTVGIFQRPKPKHM